MRSSSSAIEAEFAPFPASSSPEPDVDVELTSGDDDPTGAAPDDLPGNDLDVEDSGEEGHDDDEPPSGDDDGLPPGLPP